jgi:hypothetical protein
MATVSSSPARSRRLKQSSSIASIRPSDNTTPRWSGTAYSEVSTDRRPGPISPRPSVLEIPDELKDVLRSDLPALPGEGKLMYQRRTALVRLAESRGKRITSPMSSLATMFAGIAGRSSEDAARVSQDASREEAITKLSKALETQTESANEAGAAAQQGSLQQLPPPVKQQLPTPSAATPSPRDPTEGQLGPGGLRPHKIGRMQPVSAPSRIVNPPSPEAEAASTASPVAQPEHLKPRVGRSQPASPARQLPFTAGQQQLVKTATAKAFAATGADGMIASEELTLVKLCELKEEGRVNEKDFILLKRMLMTELYPEGGKKGEAPAQVR